MAWRIEVAARVENELARLDAQARDRIIRFLYERILKLSDPRSIGQVLKGELLIYDALKATFRKVRIPKNPECPVCSDNPRIKELIEYQ